jgi:hypothetical protein
MGFLWWGSSEDNKVPVEWVFLPLGANAEPAPPGAADTEYYITIDLGSMRIPAVNRAYAKLYGAVHSFISVPTFLSAANAQFRVVTTPTNLKNIDAANLDRVLQINKRLLGPIPYRGGRLTLEMGLYSVKSADLLDPYLSLLQEMSGEAGVAFVKNALPFVGLLKKGIDLITGNAKDSTLEIGLSTELEQPQMGWYLVMAAPKDAVQPNELKVDPKDSRLLDGQGKPYVQYPYMLFRVSASLQRTDWFQIPELVESHTKLREALLENDLVRAQKLLEQFSLIANTCPDLLKTDAARISEELKKRYDITVPKVAAQAADESGPDIGELKELRIYG